MHLYTRFHNLDLALLLTIHLLFVLISELTYQFMDRDRDSPISSAKYIGQTLASPLNFIKLFRCLCISSCVLPSYRQPHHMSPANIAPNHPMMCNILPHLSPELCLNLQILQRILFQSLLLSPREAKHSRCCFWRFEVGFGKRERREGGGSGRGG